MVVAVAVVVVVVVGVIADDAHPKVVGSTGAACKGGREDLHAVPPCDGAARFITQLPLREPVQVPGRVEKESSASFWSQAGIDAPPHPVQRSASDGVPPQLTMPSLRAAPTHPRAVWAQAWRPATLRRHPCPARVGVGGRHTHPPRAGSRPELPLRPRWSFGPVPPAAGLLE